MERTILTLAERRFHPYSLTLPLLWSTFEWTGGASGIFTEPVPEAEYLDGIPLYVFDKHTAAGKRAISMLPQRSAQVRHVLAKWVPKDRWVDVTLMTAFYSDGSPVRKRLEWSFGCSLEHIGMHADLMSVGCSYEAVTPVADCVRGNLSAVNALRRLILLQGKSPKTGRANKIIGDHGYGPMKAAK